MKNTTDLNNLDFIRTSAIIMVVVSHLPLSSKLIPSFYDQASLGNLGVFIFFLHTSMVLMLSMNRHTEKNLYKFIRDFYIRRIFRIYPLSIFTVIVVYLVYSSVGVHYNYNIFWANILLIQNLTGTISIPATLWSLPVEIQMYITLPFIYILLYKYNHKSVYFLVLIWVVFILITYIGEKNNLIFDLIKFSPLFISGVISYYLFITRKTVNISPIFLILYILILFFLFPAIVNYGYISLVIGWPLVFLLGLLAAYSSDLKITTKFNLSKIIAQYSYSIYLVHFPLIDFIFNYASINSLFTKWVVYTLLLIIITFIVHHFIELPFMNYGKRFINKINSN